MANDEKPDDKSDTLLLVVFILAIIAFFAFIIR